MKTLSLIVICSIIIGISNAQFNSLGMPDNSQNQKESPISHTKTTWNVSPSKVINTIPAPTPYIADITFDGQHILCEGYNEYQIFFLDTSTGSIIKTIPTNIKRPYGLTYDGNYLWILDNENLLIKKVNKDNGNIITTVPIPNTSSTYPTGMTIINDCIWYNDAIGPYPSTTGDLTHKMDTVGNTIQAYLTYGNYPSGLTYDGQYVWISDNYEQLIHRVDISTFTVVRTIQAPGGTYPNGLAWDGKYLWVSNNDSDSLYQVDPGHTKAEMFEIACNSYTLNGETYTSSGIYTQVITNTAGFDSTITLNLTINNSQSIEIYETACHSYSLNNQDYSSSGVYVQTLTSSTGCDSTIVLNLTIISTDTSVTHTGSELIANENNASYQWINCHDGSIIAGETGQVFEPTVNGDYAVIIEYDGCTDTSACYNFYSVYSEKISLAENVFSIYPNPNNGNFNINLANNESMNIDIQDITGKNIYSYTSNKEVIDIDLNEAPGIYFVVVYNEKIKLNKKLIIE